MAQLSGNNSMGIGRLGGSLVTLQRVFRFEMSILTPNGSVVPPSFIKTAGLPNISIEETELNYLNEKTWVSGKATWEPITVTYIQAAVVDLFPLFNWIASVYNYTNTNRYMGSKASDYQGIATIITYDGCAQPLTQWTLGNCWPQAIDFGANPLDYSGSETIDLSLTLRYSNVIYTSLCPAFVPAGVCTPCNSTTTLSA